MKTLIFAMALLGAAMITTAAFAQTTIDVGNPETAGNGYTVENGVITIASSGEYTLQGSTTSNRFVVASGVAATVTLSNVSITSDIASPFALDFTGCNVTLRLVGNNALTCSITEDDDMYFAALQVEGASTTLTIEGEGALTANGGTGAAGIGSRLIAGQARGGTPGTIVIKSGTVTATGGYQGAGIGGGAECDGGNITISGGNVTANGIGQAAGIGGGFHGIGGNINISGGNVIATSDDAGAGIGGAAGMNGGNVNISGGTILATGGQDAAGIGGGIDGGAGDIRISGGSIFAYATVGVYGEGAGIGAGPTGTGDGSINISGGTIVTRLIGVSASSAKTPTTVTGGAIIAGSINTDNFGNASVITNADLTEAFIRTMFANAPKESAGGTDTITVTIHDTIYSEGADTFIKHDTIEIPGETITQHDTVRIEIPGPAQHDTIRIILHDTITQTITVTDTIAQIIEVHDTTVQEVYVVIDQETSFEYTVEEGAEYLVIDAGSAYGFDMIWFHGLQQNKSLAVYDATGLLIARAAHMPVYVPAHGVLIVAQSGKYYKFVR